MPMSAFVVTLVGLSASDHIAPKVKNICHPDLCRKHLLTHHLGDCLKSIPKDSGSGGAQKFAYS